MTGKLDRICDQLRIKLHGIDRRLEALKGNAMALSEKSQGAVESQLDRIEQRIYDSRISVDAANTRVKTWHDGKKAGFDASRESWKKERRFHQLNSRADDTEDVIRRRQEVYAEQTAPLIEVYRDRDLLIEVDGLGEVDDVTQRIFAALDVIPES